jgi:hypothetical protein
MHDLRDPKRPVVKALADPTVRQRFVDQGQEMPPRDQQTPEALAAYHRAEAPGQRPDARALGDHLWRKREPQR